MKKGLVLEGGAMRGLFTCGVLDVFLENGITFDGAAGISAGATFGINFKSGQAGRALRYNLKYGRDPRYCSFQSLRKTGDLYGADFCYHEIPDVLDPFDREAFRQNPMEFYIGASDVETGRPVFHRCSDCGDVDVEWMRASASMPVVSQIVSVSGRKMLDGGITCPIPYYFMEAMGYDRNVIVLTQPLGYIKKKSAIIPLMKLVLRRYPEIIRAMERRHKVYNAQTEAIRRREEAGKVLVIRPEAPLEINRTEGDPEELTRVYLLGREEAEKRLEEIRAFLCEG